MIQERQPETDFEQRLLSELRAVVAERGAAAAAAEVATGTTTTPAWRRSGPRLALAGAGATAVVVAGALIVSSGPSAETAVARVLNETAEIALAEPGTAPLPGQNQLLYTRTKHTELQEWSPEFGGGSWGALAGMGPRLDPANIFRALNTWQEESWWSPRPDGASRTRLFDWSPDFLTATDESAWLRAGSPPSSLASSDSELGESPGFPDFSRLPTEPRALRLAIERDPVYGPPVAESGTEKMPTAQVIAELWDILDKPNTTPELRAAIFGALAELPGIELNREARNAVGRPGYALGYEAPASEGYGETTRGFRVEYIFDPETAEILGRRQTITHPELVSWAKGLPAGTVMREVAYLQSGVVDSTRERPSQ